MINQKRANKFAPANASAMTVLLLRDIVLNDVTSLLARYDLQLELVEADTPIPGSYWGEPEAGVIASTVYARGDTPVHSLLHEAAHLIVLPSERRIAIHTDATDSIEEENAVCVLQALLGDALPGVGRDRIHADMDAWGYTFRLGSARAYFDHDAEHSWRWLASRGLISVERQLAGWPWPTALFSFSPGEKVPEGRMRAGE